MTFTDTFRICTEQTFKIYLQKDLEESFNKLWCFLHRMQEDMDSMNQELK